MAKKSIEYGVRSVKSNGFEQRPVERNKGGVQYFGPASKRERKGKGVRRVNPRGINL